MRIIPATLSLWLSVTWVIAFVVMVRGDYIYEPNRLIASIELAVALGVTGLSVFFIIKEIRLKKKEKENEYQKVRESKSRGEKVLQES